MRPEAGAPLPPGFDVPEPPRPEVTPGEWKPKGGLSFGGNHVVYHRIPLDPTPRRWAGGLLRISVGYNRPWNPSDAYVLFPNGYESRPNKAAAFMARKRVLFERPFERDETLESSNSRNWVLRQRGEYLTVEHLGRRRWDFSSPDGGETWRLSRIELAGAPGRFVKIKYGGGDMLAGASGKKKPRRVVFPNGAEIRYRRMGDHVTAIEGPFGREVELTRNSAGYITRIEIRWKTERGGLGPVAESYKYERDMEGRILAFEDAWGRQFELAYHERLLDAGEEKVTALKRPDDSFYYQGHVSDDEGGRYQSGWGAPGDELADAKVLTRKETIPTSRGSRLKEMVRNGRRYVFEYGHRAFLERLTIPSTGRTQVFGREGRATRIVLASGGTRTRRYDEAGRIRERTGSEGKTQRFQYDDAGRIRRIEAADRPTTRYTYDKRGYPKATRIGAEKHAFEVDEWGRLTAWDGPGDGVRRFAYDARGRLKREWREIDGRKRDVRRYVYDRKSRRTGTRDAGGDWVERWEYLPSGRPSRHEGRDGDERYRYDKLLRLTARTHAGERVERYEYHPWGFLAKKTVTDLETGEVSRTVYGEFGDPEPDEGAEEGEGS